MYIEVHQEVRENPKLLKLASLLEIDQAPLVGHLTFLWLWCMDYAQDGDLSGYSADILCRAAHWTGDQQRFVDALVECGVRPGQSGFLERTEAGLCIHDWMEYAGGLIEFRKRRAEAKRQQRAAAKESAPEGRPAATRCKRATATATSAAPAHGAARPERRRAAKGANKLALAEGAAELLRMVRGEAPAETDPPADTIRRAELNDAIAQLVRDGCHGDVVTAIAQDAISNGTPAPRAWYPWLRAAYRNKVR